MPAKKTIHPPQLFDSRAYGFSQVATVDGGRPIFMSGQVGWDENQQIVGPGDLRAQTWRAFENIDAGLRSAGSSLADVVSLRIYIVASQLEHSAVVSEALLHFFPGDDPPVSTWIGVVALANPDFLIEIEPLAIVNDDRLRE